jgi:hypothetical protein
MKIKKLKKSFGFPIILIMSVADESYFSNVSCALNAIYISISDDFLNLSQNFRFITIKDLHQLFIDVTPLEYRI